MYFDILFLLFLYKWNFFLGNIFIIFCQHCNIFLPESEFFECGNEFLSHLIYIFPNCIVFEICDWNFIIKIPDGIYCRLCIFQDNNIDQRFLHKKKKFITTSIHFFWSWKWFLYTDRYLLHYSILYILKNIKIVQNANITSYQI